MFTRTFGIWAPIRPHTMVVACSDGRLQQATDEFLHSELGLGDFDRLYVPGGGGALSASDRDVLRAKQLRAECRYLVELHEVKRILLLFHGPAPGGPAESACADYRRKMPEATTAALREQQARDALELLQLKNEWAATAAIEMYRCEVVSDHTIHFRELDASEELGAASVTAPFVKRQT